MSDPIQIDVVSSKEILIDVSNKLVNLSGVGPVEIEGALGYTPEDVANKVTSFQNTPTDTAYPSEKLVKNTLDSITSSIQETWSSFVTLSNPQPGDILVRDNTNFKNRPKEEITDGGNF